MPGFIVRSSLMHIHIPDYSRARVLVVGDVMLDQYWQGSTQRISPEAPVPVVRIEGQSVRAGGAGNVALNITAVGGRAALMGLAGDDEAGRNLLTALQDGGVECHLQPAMEGTITKLRVISRNQQLIRLDFEGNVAAADPAGFLATYQALLGETDCVILSDYAKGTLAEVTEMIRLAREHGRPVLIDPKGSDFSRYRGATLLTPNMGEFEAVVGTCRDTAEIEARGEALRQSLGLEALLVTRGEHGMSLIEAGRPPLHIPAIAREVYDVTGAGDSVVAMLAAGLAAGQLLPEAVQLANLAAGVVVGKLGTATASVEEITAAMQVHAPIPLGVMAEPDLLDCVARARRSGERIVMTNGCFDLLHAGHVAYLEQARSLGDRLIVAVNDDASVRRLKGDGRPVNTLAARMAVLAGLASVDWVVAFSEDTPERLICQVRPDILVKGGDYRPEEVAGGRCAGETTIMPFLDGHSTTRMIQTIRKV
ncbi:MAG: bifunctional D-glycero-beta-D-manno-heptose-7-phosphate kinase/D-glycero-beta-D-manno-heptose 1-phosphate adenylyltransferase HldE [Gallionellaceae bacterium]|nr:bifunctional D-glycero-beta-D-manno-heptose-7-phosphate kinase/D-glycero-beta-D-manno-heptose 1-phosphate adenylyltransferase HldE [Gallionellaceae bacterium]